MPVSDRGLLVPGSAEGLADWYPALPIREDSLRLCVLALVGSGITSIGQQETLQYMKLRRHFDIYKALFHESGYSSDPWRILPHAVGNSVSHLPTRCRPPAQALAVPMISLWRCSLQPVSLRFRTGTTVAYKMKSTCGPGRRNTQAPSRPCCLTLTNPVRSMSLSTGTGQRLSGRHDVDDAEVYLKHC